MNAPDLSTKLKLMGVDVSCPALSACLLLRTREQVASFGDFFADRDAQRRIEAKAKKIEADKENEPANGISISEKPSAQSKRRFDRNAKRETGNVMAITYKDPFGVCYKKYIFSADGKHLLGGIMVCFRFIATFFPPLIDSAGGRRRRLW